MPELVTAADIEERLGIRASDIRVWVSKRDYLGFPRPTKYGNTNLYDYKKVLKWAEKNGRIPENGF